MKKKQLQDGRITVLAGETGGQSLIFQPGKPGSLSVLVSFLDGVAFEENDEWGISHFLEHLHFQGTPAYPSLTAITSVIEEEGGKISAFSMRDSTSYFVKAPSWGLKTAFHLLADVLTNTNFSPDTIESEKSIVSHEMAREKANYTFFHNVSFEGSLLAPLPASRYPIGNKDSISGINSERIVDYKKKAYVSHNCHITIAGAVDMKMAEKEIARFLSSLPQGEKRRAPGKIEPAESKNPAFLEYPGLGQVNIAVGWGIMDDVRPDWIRWSLLHTLLGVGFGCMLYRSLREEHHLTYLISAQMRIYSNCAVFKVSLDVKPGDVEKALSLIDMVMEKVRHGEIDDDDLKRAQSRLWGNTVLRLEDTLENARFLNRLMLTECPIPSLEEIRESIYQVRAGGLAEMAERYLAREKFMVSLAGSKERSEKLNNRDQ